MANTELINGVYHTSYREIGGGGGGTPNAVQYVPQTLTDAQKAQARQNIGGASSADLNQTNTALGNLSSIVGDMQPKVEALVYPAYVVAWDGSSSPVVANIPAGVAVTYDGDSYTGTLAASSSTLDKIYLVSTGTTDNYYRYVTQLNGSTYSWQNIGSTAMDLSDYATKEELAAQGVVLGDVADEINGYVWQDIAFAKADNYAIRWTDGIQIYTTSYCSYNYIEIPAGCKKVRFAVFKVTGAANTYGYSFYNSSKGYISGGHIVNATVEGNEIIEVRVPEGAAYFRSCVVKPFDNFVCMAYVPGAASYGERITALENEHAGERVERLLAEVQANDMVSVVAVDLMKFCHSRNLIASLSIMDVVSSTEDTLTLSSADAANFSNATVAVVKFSNGSYKPVFFAARDSGNTITRDVFDSTNLSTAVQIQSLHDTLQSDNGQHLSAFGYLAMAQFVAMEMKKKIAQRDKNYLEGVFFNFCKLSAGWQDTDANNGIFDFDDNLVCLPKFSQNWQFGGSGDRGVSNNNDNATLYNGWLKRAYVIKQSSEGAYMDFPLSVNGKGFVEIVAAKRSDATASGGITLSVYADGVLVQSWPLTKNMTAYVAENLTVYSELKVRLSIDSAQTSMACVYSIGFWQMYDKVPALSVDGISKVAVVGDSWSEFPGAGGAIPGSAYNTLIVRPDGTTGDGYGYFPKELATQLGVSVDNWGYGGQRLDQTGFQHIDDVVARGYDVVVLEHFVNDYNSSEGMDTYISYVKQYVKKCKQHGIRVVLLLPCYTNSLNQSLGLGEWHEALAPGIGSI